MKTLTPPSILYRTTNPAEKIPAAYLKRDWVITPTDGMMGVDIFVFWGYTCKAAVPNITRRNETLH